MVQAYNSNYLGNSVRWITNSSLIFCSKRTTAGQHSKSASKGQAERGLGVQLCGGGPVNTHMRAGARAHTHTYRPMHKNGKQAWTLEGTWLCCVDKQESSVEDHTPPK